MKVLSWYDLYQLCMNDGVFATNKLQRIATCLNLCIYP